MLKLPLADWLRRGLVGSTPGGEPDDDQPGYVSDFARYMEDFLHEHPEVIEDQRRGWAIWWKRKTAPDEEEKAVRDTVPPDAYYYFPAAPPGDAPKDGSG